MTCSGTVYTRCDPTKPANGSNCLGWWKVDGTYNVAVSVTAAAGGELQAEMTQCARTSLSRNCGQKSSPAGHATFERSTTASFAAANVLVDQTDPYPFIGTLRATASGSNILVTYSGDTGWVWAGSVAERGTIYCSGTLTK
jgi:hypothetical protein